MVQWADINWQTTKTQDSNAFEIYLAQLLRIKWSGRVRFQYVICEISQRPKSCIICRILIVQIEGGALSAYMGGIRLDRGESL